MKEKKKKIWVYTIYSLSLGSVLTGLIELVLNIPKWASFLIFTMLFSAAYYNFWKDYEGINIFKIIWTG